MRISGGNLRGRVLHPPANLPVRPTTDFAKTALFNILTNHYDFVELNVLDLFAGAGSITFEFASRNAKSIKCIDDNANCIKFIKETASLFNVSNITVVKSDVFSFLKNAAQKWDIIFADPPFEMKETDKIPELVFENNLLSENGMLIVEHQSKRSIESIHQPFQVRKYGNCAFSLFRNNITPDNNAETSSEEN